MESLFIFALGCGVGYYICLFTTDKKAGKKSEAGKPTETKKSTNTGTPARSLRKEVSWAQPNRKTAPVAVHQDTTSRPETTPVHAPESSFEEPAVTSDEPSTEREAETPEINPKFKNPFQFETFIPLDEDETEDPLKELCIRSLERMEGEIPVGELVSAVQKAHRLIRELEELLQSPASEQLPASIFEQVKAIGEKMDATNVAHLCVDRLTEIAISVQVERPELESEFSGAFVEVNRKYA